MYRILTALFIFCCLYFISALTHAQSVVQGSAIEGPNGCARITASEAQSWQTGAFWSDTTINLNQPFDMTFETFFGCVDGEHGGDGLAFVLHQDPRGKAALGGGGGFLGYGGNESEIITPSLIVELDTYDGTQWGGVDIPDDHLAVQVNGDVNSNVFGPVSVPTGELEACGTWGADYFTVQVIWDPAEPLFQVITEGEVMVEMHQDIISHYFNGPEVWFGWTGATGDASNEQWVCPAGEFIPWECTFNSCCEDVEVQITGDDSILCAVPAVLTAVGDFDEYQWSNGATTASISVDQPGTYELVAVVNQDGAGCAATASFTVHQGDFIPSPWDTVVCSTSAVVIQAPSGYMSYSWTSGASTQQIHLDTAVVDTVLMAAQGACIDTGIVHYTRPTIVEFDFDYPEVCAGGNALPQYDGSLPAGSFVWEMSSDGDDLNAATGEVSLDVSSTENRSVIFQADQECERLPRAFQAVIPVAGAQSVEIIGPDSACEGRQVVWNAPPGFDTYTWILDNNGQQIIGTDRTLQQLADEPKAISLVAQSSGCAALATKQLEPIVLPDFELNAPEAVCADSLVEITGPACDECGFQWLENGLAAENGFTWTAHPNESLALELIITRQGCVSSAQTSIEVLPGSDLWIPSAFSPNGDGKNDLFIPVVEGDVQLTTRIFNRWGDPVFVGHDTAYWEGSVDGQPLEPGVYNYRVDVSGVCREEERIFGKVMLVR